jgi:hypothetical protein
MAEHRRREKAAHAAGEKVRREREAAAARESHLALAQRENEAWCELEALIANRSSTTRQLLCCAISGMSALARAGRQKLRHVSPCCGQSTRRSRASCSVFGRRGCWRMRRHSLDRGGTTDGEDCRGCTGGEETFRRVLTARLDQLIEEAIVDAYGDSEQTSGFYTMLEDHLDVPFTVEIFGAQVTVDRVDLTDDERIVAVSRHGKTRQRVSILDLPVPDSPPTGWEWIEAYRRFMRGR